jgi:hypothetical protein
VLQLEPVVPVPGDVPLRRGLQVPRHAGLVETAEHGFEQLPAQPLGLTFGLDADDREVPVRSLRVQLLGLRQIAEPVAKRVGG